MQIILYFYLKVFKEPQYDNLKTPQNQDLVYTLVYNSGRSKHMAAECVLLSCIS